MTLWRLAAVAALPAMVAIAACDATAGPSVAVTPRGFEPAAVGIAPPAGGAGPELVSAASVLARPAQPILEPRFGTALVDDHCVDRDLAAPPATDIILTVLDRSYALSADYVPPDLVPASSAGLRGLPGSHRVRSIVIDDLSAMRAAWEREGLSVILESAYRSYASQAATFEAWAARLGRVGALLRSARPGHSEHQLGTALDVSSPGWTGRVGDWAAESAEGAWMAAHAWEYGFVMSYPPGSQARTCFSYEPWHFRWIGREAAAAHRSSGLQLRQFLERYVDD